MQSPSEFSKRIKLLMEYNNSSTYSENLKYVNEQRIGSDSYLDRKNQEILNKLDDTKKIEVWKQGCKYPDKAKKPSREADGVSGEEAMMEGYCVYLKPSYPNEKYGSGMYFPADAEITFFDYDIISKLIDQTVQKHPNEYKDSVIKQFSKIIPINSVAYFDISGLKYIATFKKEVKKSNEWVFYGYWTDYGKIYTPPKWNDPRNEWDKIVDDYLGWAQLGTTVVFFIAGFFTEGATWLIWLEIVSEGVLGGIQAQRYFEKGENISGVFEVFFALTPWLKTTDFFRLLDPDEVRYIFKEMEIFGLNKNSPPEKVLEFYNSLHSTYQKTFKRMLDNTDEFSELAMKKRFDDIASNLRNYIKQNPGEFKSLAWYKKMASRELGVEAGLFVLNTLTEVFYGEELNDEEKKKASSFINNAQQVSEELAEEIQYNFVRNSDKIKQILKNKDLNELYNDLLSKELLNKSGDFLNGIKIQETVRQSIENLGEPYVDLETDSTLSPKEISYEEIEKYIQQGYKKESEISQEEWDKVEEQTPIKHNNEFYWKISN